MKQLSHTTRPEAEIQVAADVIRRLTRAEAAEYLSARGLRIAASSLAAKATKGGGPCYAIWGNRAVYDIADLEAWAAERLGKVASSTAERTL